MPKKSKLSTPGWILEGYDSEEDYTKAKELKKEKKGKILKLKKCPKCDSDEVAVVIGENGIWECHKCKWRGIDIDEKELTEDEFMKYLDDKGEEVA